MNNTPQSDRRLVKRKVLLADAPLLHLLGRPGCDECPDCFAHDRSHVCLTPDGRCRKCGFVLQEA